MLEMVSEADETTVLLVCKHDKSEQYSENMKLCSRIIMPFWLIFIIVLIIDLYVFWLWFKANHDPGMIYSHFNSKFSPFHL